MTSSPWNRNSRGWGSKAKVPFRGGGGGGGVGQGGAGGGGGGGGGGCIFPGNAHCRQPVFSSKVSIVCREHYLT